MLIRDYFSPLLLPQSLARFLFSLKEGQISRSDKEEKPHKNHLLGGFYGHGIILFD